MHVAIYGKGSNALIAGAPPGSHPTQGWGAIQSADMKIGSVGASVVNTTIQSYWVSPTYYAIYVYDVAVSYYTTSNSAANSISIDIWNTLGSGTTANRIAALSGAINLPIQASGPATGTNIVSARFANPAQYTLGSDPTLMAAEGLDNLTTYPAGSVFSVRAITPGGGSIADLFVSILYAPFNGLPIAD